MQPWGAVTGRILDENGNQVPALLGTGPRWKIATLDDPSVGETPDVAADAGGRFRVDRLVPGQRYSAEVYQIPGWYAGMAFENVVVQPGEIRDLGNIRTKTPVNVIGK